MPKAAFLKGLKKIEIGNLEELPFDGIKIKVDSCAVCGSDIRIFNKGNERIKYPAIIGHEVSGVVVDSKSRKFSIGDKISIGADIPCGNCDACKSKRPNLCKENLGIGYQLRGGFSEYMYINKELINNGPIKIIPENFDLEVACLGEPLACAFNGLEKLNIRDKGNMLIFGAGPIGIMMGILAKKLYQINKIDFVEISEYRKQFLNSLGIASKILSPNYLEKQIADFAESYQYVITACGVFKTHGLGIQLLSHGGAINFFGGLPKPSPSLEVITNDIHYKELTLTGSHGSTPLQHSKAIEFILKNRPLFKKLITHKFKLSDIEHALNFASTGEGMKVLIKP